MKSAERAQMMTTYRLLRVLALVGQRLYSN